MTLRNLLTKIKSDWRIDLKVEWIGWGIVISHKYGKDKKKRKKMKITIELKDEEVKAYKSYLKTHHRLGEKCYDKVTKKIIQDEIRKFIYSQLFILSPVYYHFPEDYPISRPGDKNE